MITILLIADLSIAFSGLGMLLAEAKSQDGEALVARKLRPALGNSQQETGNHKELKLCPQQRWKEILPRQNWDETSTPG